MRRELLPRAAVTVSSLSFFLNERWFSFVAFFFVEPSETRLSRDEVEACNHSLVVKFSLSAKFGRSRSWSLGHRGEGGERPAGGGWPFASCVRKNTALQLAFSSFLRLCPQFWKVFYPFFGLSTSSVEESINAIENGASGKLSCFLFAVGGLKRPDGFALGCAL